MLKHYLELLVHYRWIAAPIFLGLTLGTAILSTFFLFVTPVYTSVAKVSMLPTDSELIFTKSFVRSSQFSPANMMTQTHMEYLISRPVVESTIDRMIAEFGTPEASEKSGFKAFMRRGFRSFKAFLRRTYNYMNSGRNVPLDGYEDTVLTLVDNIEVEMVEGTYILEISISWDNPKIAAAAANFIAEQYVAEIRKQTISASEALSEYINSQLEQSENKLIDLATQRFENVKKLGIYDFAQERQALLNSRETERSLLAQANTDLKTLVRRNDLLLQKKNKMLILGLSGLEDRLNSEIALFDANKASIETRIASRTIEIEKIVRQLSSLSQHQSNADDLDSSVEAARAEMDSLMERLHSLNLANAKGLSNLRLIDPAKASNYPSFPRVIIYTAIATAAGLVLAAFSVVFMDTVTDGVRTSTDMNRIMEEHFLGRFAPSDIVRSEKLRQASMHIRRKFSLFENIEPPAGAVVSLTTDKAAKDTATLINGQKSDQIDKSIDVELADNHVLIAGGAGESFSWRDLKSNPRWIVVGVEADSTTEKELQGFCEEARRNGVIHVFGVLLRT